MYQLTMPQRLKSKWFFGTIIAIIASAIVAMIYASNLTPTQTASAPIPLPPIVKTVVAYRSPTCGCCGEWIKRMEAAGFTVEDNITEDIEAVKARYKVPENLRSCHTAIADGYVLEGHVPPNDVQRLLQAEPKVLGIAVPGMPIGSPGMESGDIREPYAVYSFTENGKIDMFQEHPS